MFNVERRKWSESRFRYEFEALQKDLASAEGEEYDDIAQLMSEIGQDFLECYTMVCGVWERKSDSFTGDKEIS